VTQRQGKKLVLHVITRLDFGGSSQQVLQLADTIRAHGYDSVIVSGRTVNPHIDLALYQSRTGVRIIELDSLRREPNPVLDAVSLIKLYGLIRQLRPDIVHTNCSKAGIVGRLAAVLAGERAVVHTTHGHLFYGYYGDLVTRLIILTERFFAPLAKRIVLLTEKSIEEHVARGVARRDKFVAISPGIDLTAYRQDAEYRRNFREKHGIEAEAKVIGWAGRLTQIKSPRTFLEAAAIVADQAPDTVFAVLGEGELLEDLRIQVRKLGLEGKIVFLGKTETIPRFMASIDLFTLTSSNEGLGIVLLEAMASGVPVVATAVGGVPEVLDGGRTGLLVRSGDSLSLARCMLTILGNSHYCQELAAKGLKRSLLYTEERTLEKYLGLYGEILSNGNGKKAS